MFSPTRGDLVGVIDAVLERENHRLVPHHRRQFLRRLVGVVGLDAKEDNIHRADLAGVRGKARADVKIALDTFYSEAFFPHRLEIASPRDESDVLSRGSEPRAEVAADRSRPHDGDTH